MISLRGDFFVSLKILYNLRLTAQSINGLSSKNYDAKGVRNPYENREMTQCSMNTRSFIFFTRILARIQISYLTSEGFLLRFYRSQFWRLQKPYQLKEPGSTGFIGHNFGDYKNTSSLLVSLYFVLSVTILETTKTSNGIS